MQIYRHMDIGTAKPTMEEQNQVAHHLIDIAYPDEHFDALTYSVSGRRVIGNLRERGIFPLVVGGTGLYIQALLFGLFPQGANETRVRVRLKEELEQDGPSRMHRRLEQVDPESARNIHPHDSYRIVRALEVYETTGKSIRDLQNDHGFSNSRYRVLKIGLYEDRDVLYHRINLRVDAMLEEGFLQEVDFILKKGYSSGLKAMKSIGYRHMADYLEGRSDYESAVETMKRDTRRYAKRQLTWFRADSQVNWHHREDYLRIRERIGEFLSAE
jgi:tRNA dimethylallyltransferase